MVTAPSTTFGAAQTIALGVPTPGRINSSGDSNYFKFELDQAADVAIMASATSRVVGELLAFDERVLQTHSGGFLDQPGFVLRGQLAAGTYYIHVSLSAVGNVPFAVLVTEASSPGSTSATALRLPLFAPETGRLTSSTDQEYFRFTLAEAVAVSIRAQPFGDPFTLEPTLLDDQDTMLEPYVIPRAAYAEDGQPFNLGIVGTLAAGTYYLKVAPATGESGGPYLISIQVDRDYEALLQRCTNLTSPQSDPLYGCQSHLKNTGRFGGARYDINVEPAWATTKGEGVNVAIVDRGIHAAHEDLVDNVLAGRNHDYYARDFLGVDDQGTRVAGLIAARDNDIGVRGVAPRATIYSYNLTARGNFSAADEADAMTRNMVDTAVSNNSWGYSDTGVLGAGNDNSIWPHLDVDGQRLCPLNGSAKMSVWLVADGR